MWRYLVDEIERNPRIEVLTGCDVVALDGERELDAVVVRDMRTGERQALKANALFPFIGARPSTAWLRDQVAMDDQGFLLTGPDLHGHDLAAHGGRRALRSSRLRATP
jgi:thioredoxin reductase (NADPH)